MAGISFGGISSGLDTKSIVDQLMTLEANPQKLLQQKLTKQGAVTSALQAFNSKLSSLATSATALAKPDAWTATSATSSSSSVTVATSAGSGAGTLTFEVVRLATKHSYASADITDGNVTGSQTFDIVPAGGGDPVSVTAANGDAGELARAINAADAGVVATAVRTGDGTYRLLLTAEVTGAASDFSLSGAAPAMVRLSTGDDAKIDLGGGIILESPTNTFNDLMSGVSVTVTKQESAVTVTSAPDTAAVARQAAGMVGALGVVLSEIGDRTRSTPGSVGVLAGSSLLRGIQQELLGAVSAAVPGATLADLGIQLTREGAVTIDQAAFAAFAGREPEKVKALTTAFSAALADVAKRSSAPTTGTVSLAIASGETAAKDLDSRIDGWDVRLELRRAALDRQFTAMELALSRSQSTSSWLTGALAGLSPSS